MRTHALLAAVIASSVSLAITGHAYAQGATPPGVPPVGDLVPAWVFYWLLGLSTAVGAALVAAIKVLWTHATTEREAAIMAATTAVQDDLKELRKFGQDWRTAFEASEKGRREDAERFRVEERETLKVSIKTFVDVTEALRANTQAIHGLISGSDS